MRFWHPLPAAVLGSLDLASSYDAGRIRTCLSFGVVDDSGPQALVWRSAWGRARGLPDKKQEEAMLQKLDNEHLNRLALAEALTSMNPRDFDMRRRDRCICGHALRLVGKRSPYFGRWESQLAAGANLLGLSTDQARELFAPGNRAKQSDPYTYPQDAARVMRYLAATDTVDWSVAGKL
jgi:hypothetical protein